MSWQKWKLPVYMVLIIGSIVLGAQYTGSYGLFVKAALVVVGALGYIGVFGLMHESAHGHLALSGRGNRLLGEAMSVLVGTSYPGYRAAHLMHHARFRTEDDPQEIIFPSRPRPLTAALLMFAAVLGAPVFLLVRAPVLALKHNGAIRSLWGPVASVALYATLVAVLPEAYGRALLVTVAAGYVLGSLNDIVYHQGLVDDDTLRACTSFDCDVFGQLFLSGANRHAEHHAYPAVPGPRLVELSRTVRAEFLALGVPYERAFTIGFVRRLVSGPAFLPPAAERPVAQPAKAER